MAQIHRFNNKVAINLGDKTVYIRASDALELGQVLIDCARDIESREFSNSKFETYQASIVTTK